MAEDKQLPIKHDPNPKLPEKNQPFSLQVWKCLYSVGVRLQETLLGFLPSSGLRVQDSDPDQHSYM